jgi:hypothetical protein
MAVQNESPYAVHLFVCTNDRAGERKSCADDHGLLIKAAIKKAVDEKGWKGKVRVSASGCLGALLNGAQCDDLSAEDMVFRGIAG